MVSEVKVFILAGGLGTRLAHITRGVPKPMALIAGKPFLEWQIDYIAKQGFSDFVFLVGHQKERIVEHFGDGSRFGVRMNYSEEKELLGTGGAFIQGLQSYPCSYFILVNGDTFFNVSFNSLIENCQQNPQCLILALKEMENASRYGFVDLDPHGYIRSFREKSAVSESGLINGGLYAGSSVLFKDEKIRRVSMETELFPVFLNKNLLRGVVFDKPFIDIGIPDDYNRAQSLIPHFSGRE